MGAVVGCEQSSQALSDSEEIDNRTSKGNFGPEAFAKRKSSQSRLQSRLAIALANVSRSDIWENMKVALRDHWVIGQLPRVADVVCLCLGSLEEDATIHQLALLVLLLWQLDIHHENCSIFDPCNTLEDIDILKQLGFSLLNVNDEARICVQRMTLFYMPYADYILTDNLIETNRSTLHLISIIGNSLSWVCDTKGEYSDAGEKRSRAPNVHEVLALAKETKLTHTFAWRSRMDLATFTPTASLVVRKKLNEFLGCTLTTFPQSVQMHSVEWQSRI